MKRYGVKLTERAAALRRRSARMWELQDCTLAPQKMIDARIVDIDIPMTKLMKLIWRLDHDTNYTLLNRLGTARQIVSETVPEFWNSVADGALIYSILGDYTDNSTHRNISVELHSLNGIFEWAIGTEFAKVFQTEEFRKINRIVAELLRATEIGVMRRAGIRFLGFGEFKDGRREGYKRFSNLIQTSFLKSLNDAIKGSIDDLSLTFTGNTDDGLGYRILCGPYKQTDVQLILSRARSPEQERFTENSDFTFDIDIFERNISFVEHNLFRWASTKLERAGEFVAMCENLVL